MKLNKVIFISCVMLAAVLFANGVLVLVMPGKSHVPPGSTYHPETGSTVPHAVSPESGASADRPVNLLVLGLDEEEVRTDVIMLFNFNPGLSRLNILSIARDTRVFSRGRYSKINALYSAGKEGLVASEIRQITGLQAQYYITLDFKGFRKLIDSLGGVTFNVPFRMDYDDPDQDLHIHLDKGVQLLNGNRAEQLVRYRKGNNPGEGYTDGDIGRIQMQQEFLTALFKQKLSLKYASRVDDVSRILTEYVKTNISIADITHYMGWILKMEPEDVRTFTLPGKSDYIGGVWYYNRDEGRTSDMINENFYK